jgi:serine/threonine protein kinase
MDHSQELPMIKRLSICLDVADGMSYLHNRTPPIIHRDLKSHNIFITEPSPGNYVAKIGDWGSARAVALTGSKSMTQGVGTACWLSPEVINNAHFSKSSDVYAFGIVLWEVFTRQEIYEGLSAAQIIAKVAHEGLRPHVPKNCPWAKIMTQCWRQDPNDRPDFDSISSALSDLHQEYSRRLRDRMSGTATPTSTPHSVLSDHNEDDRFIGGQNMDGLELTFSYQSAGNKNQSLYSTPSSGARRDRRFYDSFHPSLENIRMVIHDEARAKNKTMESAAAAAAHLAPEIAQLEAQSLLHEGELRDIGKGLNGGDSNEYDEADPIDFLFRKKKKKTDK